MQYASFTLEDGVTFVHINMEMDQETLGKINEVEAPLEHFKRREKQVLPWLLRKLTN